MPARAALSLLKTALPGCGAGWRLHGDAAAAVERVVQLPQIAVVLFPGHDVAGTASASHLLRLDHQPRDGAAGRVELEAIIVVFQNRLRLRGFAARRRRGSGQTAAGDRRQYPMAGTSRATKAISARSRPPSAIALAVEQLHRHRLAVGTDQSQVHDLAVGEAHVGDRRYPCAASPAC